MKKIEEYFEEERKYLNYFFDHIDLQKAKKVFQKLYECKGTIIFTGIGKSGIIAQKLATTLISTGTKALYIPAIDALHGDLGIVDAKDIFVLLSKSGATEELLNLLPHIREKGGEAIAIVSQENSKLYNACDVSICLPIPRELCPFDLAPTTSAEVQLIFGDILAVALMDKKKFSLKDFALNHPAGMIGKKITLKVCDLMITGKQIPLTTPEKKLIDILFELSEKRCGCLLVVDEQQKLLGIFTDGDLRRAIQKKGPESLHQKVSELMTVTPRSISQNQLAYDAMQQMEEDPKQLITVLPVVENDKVTGIIRMHDILQSGLREKALYPS